MIDCHDLDLNTDMMDNGYGYSKLFLLQLCSFSILLRVWGSAWVDWERNKKELACMHECSIGGFPLLSLSLFCL